jgi:hypothetical protein
MKQTLLPSQIVIVYDVYLTQEEFDLYTHAVQHICSIVHGIHLNIIHPFTHPMFTIGKGASYLRNYGIQQVTSPDMMCIDDDNTFDEDFMQKIFEYKKNKQHHPDQTLVVPLQYDDTTTFVRQAVADGFNFLLCRPKRLTDVMLQSSARYFPLTLSSSNCLIGATYLFKKFPFRETVPFVYEDLIMTGEMSQSGIHIVCDTWSPVVHAHGKRSILA